MAGISGGVVLSAIAGILNGSFAAPTKYSKRWKWENIWAVWGLTAMIIVPWLLVLATVPNAASFYAHAPARPMWLLIIFGVGFGIAQILFGLGIAAIGIALNFAIAIGLSTALGSIIPLVMLHQQTLFTPKGKAILVGVALILLGIVLSAIAGHEKEKELKNSAADPATTSDAAKPMSFKAGLIICIFAGLGSPLINFGLAFGTPLLTQAAQAGVNPASQANVIWAPLVTASFVPYILYCAYLWRKNRTFHLYAAPETGINWLYGAVMGLLWMGSVAIYGAASADLQSMGPILGWPLFMSAIIITSNIWGFATGEWKGTSLKPRGIILSGIGLLILGFAAIAVAGQLH